MENLGHLIVLLVLLGGLFATLIGLNIVSCGSVHPLVCDVKYSIVSGGSPKILIVAGEEGLGEPEFLAQTLRSPRISARVKLIELDELSLPLMQEHELVIVERAKKICTNQLELFIEYVAMGGRLVWIGDAGTQTCGDSHSHHDHTHIHSPKNNGIENEQIFFQHQGHLHAYEFEGKLYSEQGEVLVETLPPDSSYVILEGIIYYKFKPEFNTWVYEKEIDFMDKISRIPDSEFDEISDFYHPDLVEYLRENRELTDDEPPAANGPVDDPLDDPADAPPDKNMPIPDGDPHTGHDHDHNHGEDVSDLLKKSERYGGEDDSLIGPWARKSHGKQVSMDYLLGVNYLGNYCDFSACFTGEQTGTLDVVDSSHSLVRGIGSSIPLYGDFALVVISDGSYSNVLAFHNNGTNLISTPIGIPWLSQERNNFGKSFPFIVVSGLGERVSYYSHPPEYFVSDKMPLDEESGERIQYWGLMENLYYGLLYK